MPTVIRRTLQAVFFDADGVVQRADPSARTLLQEVLGCRREDLDSWQTELFRIEEAPLDGSADFETGVRAILAERSCPGTWEDFLHAWTAIEVDESVVSLIRALRAESFGCFLASNQERHRAEWMSRELGYGHLFDAEFYSHSLGVTKPDARFFEKISRLTQVSPKTALFLDDRSDNVAAARRAGMHAECVQFGSVLEVVETYT